MNWDELQEAWRRGGLEEKVRGHRRAAVWTTVFELIFAAVSIGGAIFLAAREQQRWSNLWALMIVILFAVAFAYALWNRRDALWPSSAAPLDFLAEAELRLKRQLEMLRFMLRLGAVEAVISLVIFWLAGRAALPLGAAVLAAVCLAGYAWIRRSRKHTQRELEAISRLRRELD
jgi:hypothetical protein